MTECPDIVAVERLLGRSPRTAIDIAAASGIALEQVYGALVWLHDRRRAWVNLGGPKRVRGWTG